MSSLAVAGETAEEIRLVLVGELLADPNTCIFVCGLRGMEEAVLDAVERGQLSLRVTRVVVNCAVVSVDGGRVLPGARLRP